MNKKKILMLQPNAHKVYWGWYKYLNDNNNFNLIVPKNTEKIPFLEKKQHNLERSWWHKLLIKTPLWIFIDLKNINKTIEQIKPDIILSKIYYEPYTLKAYKYAINNNVPFLVIEEQQNYPLGFFKKNLFKIILHYCKNKFKNNKILCVTKSSQRFLKKYYNTIYLPVSIKDKNKKITHLQDKIRLLFIGRLTEVKNIPLVFKTIRHLLDTKKIKEKELMFTIVGSGEFEKDFKQVATKLKIEKMIDFKGYINNKELIKISKESNIFILPSKQEAIGLVVLEAMSFSMPILCSNKAGAHCYVENGINGYSFKPNVKDLSEKILSLKNAKKREEMGKNSLKLIKETYSEETIGKKLTKIIENEINN